VERKIISEEFAQQLLAACYELDVRLSAVESLCAESVDTATAEKQKEAFAELLTVLGADIMLPLYTQHPQLGRIMEPGSWLKSLSGQSRLVRQPT